MASLLKSTHQHTVFSLTVVMHIKTHVRSVMGDESTVYVKLMLEISKIGA